jgi:hypothetical protein
MFPSVVRVMAMPCLVQERPEVVHRQSKEPMVRPFCTEHTCATCVAVGIAYTVAHRMRWEHPHLALYI